MREKNISASVNPPYFPDLAPADFSLFLELRILLKGTPFSSVHIKLYIKM
jgi:hypothetical protein